MTFSYQLMLQRFKGHIREKIVDVYRETNGYSNNVYSILTEGGKYIYKEYTKYNDDEVKICKVIGYPRILVSNEKYRIEEYIDHVDLDFDHDMEAIASAMKKFHSIAIDGIAGYDAIVDKYMEMIILETQRKLGQVNYESEQDENILNGMIKLENLSHADKMKDMSNSSVINAIDTLASVRERLKRFNESKFFKSKTLCHNDLQPGNMLNTGEEIVFIDFEFASTGNPAIDIANLFCEKMCDYNECVLKNKLCWDDSEKRKFLRAYAGFDSELLFDEVKNAEVCSHFLWFVWGIACRENKCSNFNFDGYTKNRLGHLLEKGFISDEEHQILLNL